MFSAAQFLEDNGFAGMVETLPDAALVMDAQGVIISWNRAMQKLTGIDPANILGKPVSVCARALYGEPLPMLSELFLRPDAADESRFRIFSRNEHSVTAEEWISGPGRGAYMQSYATVLRNSTGENLGVVQTLRNAVARDQAEKSLKRLNRALTALSETNQVLVNAGSESELLNAIVKIITAKGYRLAWIGYFDKSAEAGLRIVASSGFEAGLDASRIVCQSLEFGCDAVASASSSQTPFVINDIHRRRDCDPCQQDATERGYSSTLTLPLSWGDSNLGIINIYAEDAHAFDSDEESLLQKLADDLAYGVVSMRTAKERDAAVAELKRAHGELELKVADRTRELMSANERLKELDKLKSMFIASMSHELRTPLNSIIGFTGIILKGLSGDINDKQREQLERVYGSGKHLMELISDVIDISKIEGDRVDIYPQYFSLSEVLEEVMAAHSVAADRKKLEYRLVIRESLHMYSDRKRVSQVITNLVSNAIKYTEAGSVTVSVRDLYGMVEVSVSDTGIGIAQNDLSMLFEAFERIDSRLKVKEGGTGLGLYLTQKIVTEILGGEIEVDSKPGEGSVFRIRFARDMREF